ncbi:MAG: class I SAM-dependent methyltransferase [Spirochaetaceae bacterium]|jgi:demethylmenaquinone methyltransferase/2-methoxy-6-polyprenyl-1,4-benzoquinol methylase|nr:class I SAM-dependent methyltransferase [Spirochaetaceae bacterium]
MMKYDDKEALGTVERVENSGGTDKEAYFNGLAEKWDHISRHNMAKVERMLALLSIKPGDTVLDVGTGTGVLLSLLARLTDPTAVTAIDSAEKMIAVARRKTEGLGITFVAGDALSYPFQPETFDHIVCYSVFPHFEDKRAVTRRLSGLLKRGGLLSVLHSDCRDKINRVHIHAGHQGIHGIRGDDLPPARVVMNCMKDCALREEILIDSEELYMVCARKPWQPPQPPAV